MKKKAIVIIILTILFSCSVSVATILSLNNSNNAGEIFDNNNSVATIILAGDFKVAKILLIINYIIPILFLLVSLLLWKKYGKDKPAVSPIEFYPPDSMNSLDMAFIVKGRIGYSDIASLLMYLANKGYLKICKDNDDYRVIKLKEYDGNNIDEQTYFNELFKRGNEIKFRELKNRFNDGEIIRRVESKENIANIFEGNYSGHKLLLIVLIILVYIIITIPVSTFGKSFFIIILSGVAYSIFFNYVLCDDNISDIYYSNGKPKKSKIGKKLWMIFFCLVWLFCSFGSFILPNIKGHIFLTLGYVVGVLCSYGITMCLRHIKKRNKYGQEMYEKILGFKKYLEVIDSEGLKDILVNKPNYLYDILPYAYVLAMDKEWIEKFIGLNVEAPIWLEGIENFSVMNFVHIFGYLMISAQDIMIYQSDID